MHRLGQEAALRPEHEVVGAGCIGGLHRVAVEGDAVGAAVVHIQLQVQETSLAGVEDTEAVAPRLDGGFWVDRAIGEHRVTEHLGDDRGIRQLQLAGPQLPAIRLVGVRVPQAAHSCGAVPGGVFGEDVGPDEDLVLDDDRDLAPTVLNEVRAGPGCAG